MKSTSGGPVLHLPSTSQLGNFILKVFQLIITFLCTNSLLSAQEPITDPKIFCSQPERKELVLQFQKLGLDTKFVSDFCQRFSQDQIEIKPREKTKRGLLSIEQIWAANQLQGKVNAVLSEVGQINSVETTSTPDFLLISASESIDNRDRVVASVADQSYENFADINKNPVVSEEMASSRQESEEIVISQKISSDNHSSFHGLKETSYKNFDPTSELAWQLSLGSIETSFYESDSGTKLRGNHLEFRLQRFFTPLILLGISQSYRRQNGTLHRELLSRRVDLEQLQFTGSLGIATESENGLGLHGGLIGGWSENRLNYRLYENGKSYFSDSIDNGQFIWGFEFGPSIRFLNRWKIGLRLQQQNLITAVRFAEGHKATLHPLHSYLVWAEYIGHHN